MPIFYHVSFVYIFQFFFFFYKIIYNVIFTHIISPNLFHDLLYVYLAACVV